jgi:hypothetical protein
MIERHVRDSHDPDIGRLDAHVVAEALVDHGDTSDRYGYYDRNTLRGRELLSATGIQILWEMLSTNAGARRVRDAGRYRRCLERRQILTCELTRLDCDAAQLLYADRRPTGGAAQTLLALRAIDESRHQLQERLQRLEREAERLRNDPSTTVAVPDDVPDDELKDQFERIEREVGRESEMETLKPAPPPIRDPPWLRVREFAEIAGMSYPQVARWVNGDSLPHPAEDPRNPWHPDNVPVDTSLGPRRKRLLVEGINSSYMASARQQEKLADILATRPAGWPEASLTTPLRPAA